MKILKQIAVDADLFLNRAGARSVRVRKGLIEIRPRPLVSRLGVILTEGLGDPIGQEQVDGWTINVPVKTMVRLFGPNWKDAIAPLSSDWEVNEDGKWRKARVSEQPETGEGGRVLFKLLVLGFGLS